MKQANELLHSLGFKNKSYQKFIDLKPELDQMGKEEIDTLHKKINGRLIGLSYQLGDRAYEGDHETARDISGKKHVLEALAKILTLKEGK